MALGMSHGRRVQWAVRATLMTAVAASVSANVLHANPNPISQTIAAWPPLALLATIELISRVPLYRRWLAAVRVFGTGLIASIAAWVSYWHMAGVAHRYGESATSGYLLPLSVDGLIVVTSVCLVELAGHLRTVQIPAENPEPVIEGSAELKPEPIRDVMPVDVAPRLPPSAGKIAKARARNPTATQEQIATTTGFSVRTVARHWPNSHYAITPNGKIYH